MSKDKEQKPEQFRLEERIAFRIYNGDTSDLVDGMQALDLIIELRRSEAAHGIASILRHKLEKDGYIVISDIEEGLAQFYYQETLPELEAS